jgi:hypothetical protein
MNYTELEELAVEIKGWLGSGYVPDDEEFFDIATAVAKAQGNLEKGSFWFKGIRPTPEWAFKAMTIAHFPPSEAQAVFETSGTTMGDSRGRHFVRDMELYRLSVMQGVERFMMHEPRPVGLLSLIPPKEEKSKSSLCWMVSFIMDEYPADKRLYCSRDGALVVGSMKSFVDKVGKPLVVFGTTLDFLRLFDNLRQEKVVLPKGSRIFHTGGSKGSNLSIEGQEFIERASRVFGIEADDVIEEYGMTELLSQAYSSPKVTGCRSFVHTPYLRTLVLNPNTMQKVKVGERGSLCHYDLCNVYTSIAILTMDTALKTSFGFKDITRARGAEPRGCSQEV